MLVSKILTVLAWQLIAKRTTVSINKDKCLTLHYSSKFCSICQAKCPNKAITLNNINEPIDILTCTGCGICSTVCPLGAIEQSPELEVIMKEIEELVLLDKNKLVIKCKHNERSFGINHFELITMNCLGYLDESLLLGFLGQGINCIIIENDICGNCTISHSSAVVKHLNNLKHTMDLYLDLMPLNKYLSVEFYNEDTAFKHIQTGYDSLSARKEIFNSIKKETCSIAADTVKIVRNNLTYSGNKAPLLKIKVPLRRQLFLNASDLFKLNELSPNIAKTYHKEIDTSSCKLCLACTRICPTDALKIENSSNRKIWHDPSRCLDCKACLVVCQTSSIKTIFPKHQSE